MKNTQNVIGPRAISDAVLSHGLQQTGNQLPATDFHPFDQANHRPQIIQHGRILHLGSGQYRAADRQLHLLRQLAQRRGCCLCRMRMAGPPTVELLLFPSSGRCLVVSRRALTGLLLTVMLAAAERTAQITSAGIARMRQKANTAVGAMGDTPRQTRMVDQDRVERVLILTNKRINPLVQVPIFAKDKEIADGDDKKASDSVTISNLDTPSCYFIDAKASRGSARFFSGYAPTNEPHLGTNHPVPIPSQEIARSPFQTTPWKGNHGHQPLSFSK